MNAASSEDVVAGRSPASQSARHRAPLVAHLIFRFDYGGLENGLVNLINRSSAMGYRHAVIALTEISSFADRVTAEETTFHAIRKKPGKDFGAYWRLWRLLRRLKPDIVHTRNIGTLDAVVVARLAGVGTCFHGEHGWDVHDPDGTNRKYRLMRQILSRLVNRFVTVSVDLRDWLIRTVGIRESKVVNICNGVDTGKFSPRRSDRRSRAEILGDVFPEDSIVVGGVARFEPIKDPMNLVEAFIDAVRRGGAESNRLRLLYVGDGALRSAALERLDAAGLADRALLPGSRDDIPALLACMDMFVLASQREGISNTLLEAMASGLPTIATATGGNLELVADRETGMLVPVGDSRALADAILHYLDDPEMRLAHARQARRRAENLFSLDNMVTRYAELYDSARA